MTAAQVGPYLAVERLGAGGMGEVWRGYDPRLARPVALKQIRPDRAGDPAYRRRLRREARAAARLAHPAIVQVHDLVLAAAGDWIVMEYVDGESLASRLVAGALSVREAVALGADVAEALAEAHRGGVLHRDLKAQNVMVTPRGRAKVLDFGLAKGSAEAPLSDEGTLTGEGRLLGTPRAMSPEQVAGQALDARSDLFSLGALLYEMVSAVAPFAAATREATLVRVCVFEPPPLGAQARGVPPELAELVARLLAKDPAARPESAEEVAAALARIAAALDEATGRELAAERGREGTASTATGDSSTATGETEGSSTATAATEWRVMGTTGASSTGTGTETGTGTGTASTAMGARGGKDASLRAGAARGRGGAPHARRSRLARIGAASALLTLAVFAAGSIGRARWWEQPAMGGPRYVAVATPELGGDAGGPAAHLAAQALRGALVDALVGLDGVAPLVVADEPAPPTSPRALARAEAADEVLTSRLDCQGQLCRATLARLDGRDGRVAWIDSFDVPLAEPLVAARAAAASLRHGFAEHRPRRAVVGELPSAEVYEAYLQLFLRVQGREAGAVSAAMLDELAALRRRAPRFLELLLLEAQLSSLRFFDSRDAADLERALARAAEARALAPDDPRPLIALLDVAVPAERLDEAGRALEALEELAPGHPQLPLRRALLLERRGQPAAALAAMRHAARLRPSWSTLFDLANLEVRLGELAAARRTLDALLERFPGHVKGLTSLAQLELLSGSVARAAALYQELVWRSPGFAELSNLGLAELLLGRHDEAAEHFRRAAAMEPQSAAAQLNLADAELLRGRGAEARARYQEAAALIELDPAPEHWQSLTVKAQALAHLGRHDEAVAVIRRALSGSPDNPQVAFESALVFALTGDRGEAAAQRARALRGGVEPRWFSLPWFSEEPSPSSPTPSSPSSPASSSPASPSSPGLTPASG